MAFLVLMHGSYSRLHAQTNNQLTSNEIHEGWRLLFDGKTPGLAYL